MIGIRGKLQRILRFALRDRIALPKILQPIEAMASAEDQIEASAAGQIDGDRIKAKAGVGVVGNSLPAPSARLGNPLVSVNRLRIEFSGVRPFMGTKATADHQLLLSVAVQVHPEGRMGPG